MKTVKNKLKWLQTPSGNFVLHDEKNGFWISCQPKPFIDILGQASTPETALAKDGEPWLILTGDFRKEYEKVFPKGYEACKKFYLKNIKHRNHNSTD